MVSLSFKEMCEKFEVTPRALRHYEYIELLTPEKNGRTRVYGSKECARMTLILRGRRFGFSLEDIRKWLLMYEKEGTQKQMELWVDGAALQILELEEQRKQIDEAIHDLRKLRESTKESLKVYS